MTWPANYQASFPGYPYTDNTEYVLSAYANSWVLSIQAMQAGIGFGSGASDANPLYSTAFNHAWTTITARTVNIESILRRYSIGQTIPNLNTNPANVEPVAATASAGAVGSMADSGHVHVGVTSINGQSGPVTITTDIISYPYTAAGQIIVGTGSHTGALLNPGSPGEVLQVASSGTDLQWHQVAPTSGDLKFTSAVSFDAVAWLPADGAAVSRATYSLLYGACTFSITGTASGTTISGITSTVGLAAGMRIEGPGLGLTVTVLTVAANQITVSSAPSAGSQVFTVFPYGNGNGSTTFNTINMSGRVPVGTGGNGSNIAPVYAQGSYSAGEQNNTLTASQIGAHQHTGTTGNQNAQHVHYPPGYSPGGGGATGNAFVFAFPNNNVPQTTSLYLHGAPNATQDVSWSGFPGAGTTTEMNINQGAGANPAVHAHAFTTANAGGGASHNNMQPFSVGQWLVKT